jgi:hypothetical protein
MPPLQGCYIVSWYPAYFHDIGFTVTNKCNAA